MSDMKIPLSLGDEWIHFVQPRLFYLPFSAPDTAGTNVCLFTSVRFVN